ncbi:MAG: GNAT family N-acetyltransferase [Phycisphaerae bacterium]
MVIQQLSSDERERLFSWLSCGYGGCDKYLANLRQSEQAPGVRSDMHAVIRSDDGRLLSHAAIVPKILRIGKSRLWAGLISAVYTAPEARRQGHAERLMAYLHEKFAETFDLFYLSSSPVGLGLYARCGYTIFLNDYVSRLATLTLLNLGDDASFRDRKLTEQDIPWMSEMYEQTINDRCDWSVVRDTGYWSWVLEMTRLSGYRDDRFSFAVEKDGRPCGYVIGRSGNFHGGNSDQEITILEVGLARDRTREDDGRLFQAILGRLARKAAESKIPCVCVGLDRFHPLTMHCRLKLRAVSEDFAKHDMVFFHDVERLLRTMTPELEYRLGRTKFVHGRYSLNMRFQDQTIRLQLNDGKIQVASSSNEKADMALDYSKAWHVLSGFLPLEACASVHDEHHELCAALFPPVNGWSSHLDSY